MTTVAVVPARGASRGLPRKNLQPLGGRPLLTWTLEAALAARSVDRVLVSTDDEEIARIAREAGAETPFTRPGDLATDGAHSVTVVLHALRWIEEHDAARPDVAVMLLPTQPFRRAHHVDEAIALFRSSNADAVIGVCEAQKPLHALRHVREGRLVPVRPYESLNLQRQDAEPLFGVNGSVYVASAATLLRRGTFHVEDAVPYVMGMVDSIDINTAEDLFIAEAVAAALARERQS